MAKTQSKATPVTSNFRDVDKTAVARAQAALAGGNWPTLKAPKNAKVSVDKNGVEYTRWSERVVIQTAYRTVANSGLMDVVVIAKVRQSETKENTGLKVAAHHYYNADQGEISEGHQSMNDHTTGFQISLLQATGFMPPGGTLRGSLLDKVFPSKGQPNVESPVNSKTAIANIVQQYGPKKNFKTGKPMVGEDGEVIMERRDGIESFLPEGEPDQPAADADSDEE